MSTGGPLDFEPDAPEPPVSPASGKGADAPNGPPRGFASPGGSRGPSRRYGAFLLIAAVVLIVVVTLNTLGSDGPGATGLAVGAPAPPFAAPLAGGPVTGDVNVATKADQGSAGRVPACSVRIAGVLTSCAVTGGGPTIIAFFVTLGSRCANELDVLAQARREIPAVRVIGVAIRGDRRKAARLAHDRDWGFPVVYDHDGILANMYGVAVCPHLTYLLPGGKVYATTVGSIDAVGVRSEMRALVRAARAGGWAGR